MALTVEDGTGVVGADSYATLAEVRAFAERRGLVLPSGDDAVEAAVLAAMADLEIRRYKGTKSQTANGLRWPRYGVLLYDDADYVPSDEIPTALKNALCQLTYEATQTDIAPNSKGREVLKTRVEGAVEVNYAPSGNVAPKPVFLKVEGYLAPLLASGADIGNMALTSVRL